MTTNIEGKVFAITGGASGMGLATARELATRGAKAVCIGDFNESNFATVKTELSALNPATAVEVTKLDVSSSASVESWITSIVQKFGALDGALNAAGLPQGPAGGDVPSIITEDEAIWNRIIAVNLTGIYLSCREQVKAMINLPPGPRAIVNVSSMAPFLHQGGCMFAYGASKSGVHHLSENLASNLRKFGIRVNSVCPGE
jgi:chanoclavine-I dehydrogenase